MLLNIPTPLNNSSVIIWCFVSKGSSGKLWSWLHCCSSFFPAIPCPLCSNPSFDLVRLCLYACWAVWMSYSGKRPVATDLFSQCKSFFPSAGRVLLYGPFHTNWDRAIFVWPWNENERTKQKKQTNGNRAIWLVYRTDTNARGFWLVKRTLGWKNFMPENFLEINRYFALTSYCNTIGQSNNAFSI